MDPLLSRVAQELKTEFERNKRILTFDEYLDVVAADPRAHTRGSAQYLVDCIDHFGRREADEATGADGESRFKIFDMDFADPKYRVIGQTGPQNAIYRSLSSFVKEGINNKLILLHGPNGSAKSSLIQCLMRGMEHYSQLPEGALYRFNWIFPIDKYMKQGFGLTGAGSREIHSYAKLPDDEIASRMPCDLKDHPLLLLPAAARVQYIEQAFERKKGRSSAGLPDYLTKGSLSHKSHQIFEALMTRYKGDIAKVLMHVQVERFYVSKRYRSAAVTIEPQMHVDGQARQITMDRSASSLPTSLQFLSLYELMGDLPEANRGVVDFADLLKRPVDTFKYLLTACEQGTINIGTTQASLDLVFIGSTNEIQLDAFKEFPDFTSFKARIELVRVPYILEYSEEKRIYDAQIQKIAGEKHVAPHTTFVAGLWATLTRLKKPNPSNYPSNLTEIIAALTPLDKAKLYDHAGMPASLTPDQRKYLKAAIPRLLEEYSGVPYYEGRVGASAREIKSILYSAAQDPEFECLSPLSVLRELDDFVKRVSEYEFLKQDVRDGYHDAYEFITVARNEYLSVLDQEVRESMGIFEKGQYEEYLKKYIASLSVLLKGEKLKNPITGKMETPDTKLLEEFEDIIDAPVGGKERDTFRHNVISTIGAYSLDHPNKPVRYRDVFPEFMTKLENHYFEQEKSKMTAMGNAINLFGTDRADDHSEGAKLARQTIATMQQKFGYCEGCAKAGVQFLIKTRY